MKDSLPRIGDLVEFLSYEVAYYPKRKLGLVEGTETKLRLQDLQPNVETVYFYVRDCATQWGDLCPSKDVSLIQQANPTNAR